MSDLMARISTQYNISRDTLHGPINVPEWGEGDRPLQIFYRPMNLSEQQDIHAYTRDGSLKSLAQTLITRALDADGNKLFKPVHMTELMKMADSEVISKIVIEMNDFDDDDEDQEKN